MIKWFRALLYFTNFNIGVTPKFISLQLGFSRKAAVRVCDLIRWHLRSLDAGIKLGGRRQTVFVDIITLRKISGWKARGSRRLQILVLNDEVNIIAIPIASRRMRDVWPAILARLREGSIIATIDERTMNKLVDYRIRKAMYGHPLIIWPSLDAQPFHNISVYAIAMKGFILGAHLRVDRKSIDKYLGHFEFIYGRRNDMQSLFWQALSAFPLR